jgi:ubiquinone/menaquinone biosynthesis C-methylase UbiE
MTESKAKKSAVEQYTNVGDAYVRSATHAKGIDLEKFLDIANPQNNWMILDVATGGGHTALTFAPYVKKVTAVDLTPNMLQTAEAFIRHEKGITNVAFELADAGALPFENGTFDLVTCRIAAHHFPDCQKFIDEGERVLTNGGLLLVQDHVLPDNEDTAQYVDNFEFLRDPSHNRAYSEKGWRAMFESSGLEIEHTEQLVKRHGLIEWAKRMNNTDETINQLIQMITDAPEPVIEWMQPLPSTADVNLLDASFVNHHIIISGRK